MRTKLIKIIFAVLILCAFSFNTSAQIITIGITAVVNHIEDADNLLEGKVYVGNTITGFYKYDTSTPDTNPSTGSGEYIHYASPYGVTLTLGDFVFSTDFDNVDFVVGIDNVTSGFLDRYSVSSRNNLPLENGVQVDSISWQLDDYGGTALSSISLPITAPILSDWDYNALGIGGGIGGVWPCYTKMFGIYAEVTSVVLVPEPASLLFFGFGILAIRYRKKPRG